ncbi:hypothetical protein [Streptomyces sp. NPDC051218]|uniref:hypothetical protein n=1 Tax=Streptomyces sp. NPDC051218 TaxID=3365645 RepID=UPI0037A86C40
MLPALVGWRSSFLRSHPWVNDRTGGCYGHAPDLPLCGEALLINKQAAHKNRQGQQPLDQCEKTATRYADSARALLEQAAVAWNRPLNSTVDEICSPERAAKGIMDE